MNKLEQKNIDRAWRIKLMSSDEDTEDTDGVVRKAWTFDTTILFGDATVIILPAFCTEATARYELAKYLQQYL